MIQQIKSILGSIFTGALYLIIAYLLDFKLNPKVANIIALLIEFIFNFIVQSYVYTKKHLTMKHVYKEIVVVIIYISINQLLLSYLISKKDIFIAYLPVVLQPHYITITRQFLLIIMYFGLTNPLSKYWVFI